MRATIKIPIQKTSTRFHRSILSVVWIHFVNRFIYLLHLLFKLIINCSKTTFFFIRIFYVCRIYRTIKTPWWTRVFELKCQVTSFMNVFLMLFLCS